MVAHLMSVFSVGVCARSTCPLGCRFRRDGRVRAVRIRQADAAAQAAEPPGMPRCSSCAARPRSAAYLTNQMINALVAPVETAYL